MRRRGDLTGWILMIVLFVGAMALIFYILLLRAQSLANMEERRVNPDGDAAIERIVVASQPVLMLTPTGSDAPVPHLLVYEA